MGGRGKERQVNCEKCGRTVRRDKAVYIEKPILQNPLERHQISEPSTYRAVLTREVAYCPGCGKHLRVYEKKIKQNIRNDERAARQREFGYQGDRGGGGGRFPPRRYDRPRETQAQGEQTNAGAQAPAQTSTQEEGGADATAADATQESKASESNESSEETESPA